VINDYDKTISALRWSLSEMDRRMKQFAQARGKDLTSYDEHSGTEALPRILVITFLTFRDIETTDALPILTGQEGVRAGVHNVVMVDRTNGKSLPSSIKNNIP
jgi:DNA segregation ATPase FtsK/SpoIIIE-like protein